MAKATILQICDHNVLTWANRCSGSEYAHVFGMIRAAPG
jgi:hypothetical protein